MSVGAHPSRHDEAAPGLFLQLLEVRAVWEHYAALALRPAWGVAARGDGHPVLVLLGPGAQSRAQRGGYGPRARQAAGALDRARPVGEHHRMEPRRPLRPGTRETIAGTRASRHHPRLAVHRPSAIDERLATL